MDIAAFDAQGIDPRGQPLGQRGEVKPGPADDDRPFRPGEPLPQTMTPSLLIDLTAGKRLELEALQGAVVRRGRARGVPTPVLDTLYAVLRPWAGGQ